MKVQARTSLEAPREYIKDQAPTTNQRWLRTSESMLDFVFQISSKRESM